MFKENMFVQITETKEHMRSLNGYFGNHTKGDVVRVLRAEGYDFKASDEPMDGTWMKQCWATELTGDWFENLEDLVAGDTVVCVKLGSRDGDDFTLGKTYEVEYSYDEGCYGIYDDDGDFTGDTYTEFAKVEDLSEPSPAPALVEAVVEVETPRPEYPMWKDLTDLEKGELLLSHHEGKAIQCLDQGDRTTWMDCDKPLWLGSAIYRVKPAQLIKIEELKAQIEELEAEL